MLARTLGAGFAIFALPAAAVDSTAWPPPSPVADRMHQLQQAIIDPQSTAGERQAARDELANLLKSPAGQSPHAQKMPARAAVEPSPRIVKPLDPPLDEHAPPVAKVEVISPPPVIATPSGPLLVTSPNVAVDPRTGAVLHAVPGGYVDPRTGKFTPVPGH